MTIITSSNSGFIGGKSPTTEPSFRRSGFHTSIAYAAPHSNKTKHREQRERNTRNPTNDRDAELKTPGRRLGPNELRQLYASTAYNVAYEIRNCQADNQPCYQE